MNIVALYGRISVDLDLQSVKDGMSVLRFNVAVSKAGKGNKCSFIKCVAFSKTAENIAKYFAKGKEIILQGELDSNDYTNKDGIKVNSTTVIVNRFFFCGGKTATDIPTTTPQTAENQGIFPMPTSQPAVTSFPDFMSVDVDGDLPFGN